MSSEQIFTVQAFLDAAESGDRAVMEALMDPDAQIIEAESLPFGGIHKGVEGFVNLARTVFTTFRKTRVELERLIGEGDYVVVIAALHGQSRHTGESFRMPITEIWKLVNGRIVEIRPFYHDTARLNQLAAAL